MVDTTASGGGKIYGSFWYDKLNRLTASSTTGQQGTSYQYDRNGNRTAKYESGKTTKYAYDVSNRLVSATVNSATVFAAAYDARTRRLGKTESGTTTLFRYDGGTNFQELQQSPGSEVTAELVRAGGLEGGIGSVLYSDKTMAPTPGPWEGFVYNASSRKRPQCRQFCQRCPPFLSPKSPC